MADMRKKYTDMKVVDLRQQLDVLGLDKNGVKMVLVERLVKHFEEPSDSPNDDECDEGGAEQLDVEIKPEVPTDHENDDGDEVLETNEDSEMVVDEGEHGVNQDEEENIENQEINDEYEGEETEEYDEANNDEETKDGEEDDEHGCDDEDQTGGNENDEEDVEGDADALNISVGDNDKLGIDEDIKPTNVEEENTVKEGSNKDDREEDSCDDPGQGVNKSPSRSNNTPTSIINDAEQDTKANEGESEDVTKKETERHIILVTGLSSETSANDLKTLFRKHGKIGRIKIMTNTRVPGSQRFAHISVISLDDLNFLVDTLNGAELKGKCIRVSKAPEDGSISRSYEIAVAAARAEAAESSLDRSDTGDGDELKTSGDSTTQDRKRENSETEGCTDGDDIQIIQDAADNKEGEGKDDETEKKIDSPEKRKEEKKDSKEVPTGIKKPPEKNIPRMDRGGHRSRKETHDRPRGGMMRNPRHFRRGEKDVTEEWRRHGPSRMEITRVHRDRMPMGRGHPGGYHHQNQGGRRRSPHAPTLTFEQIREIRDEQRKRELERRKREEERERAAEMERQKRLEYQNYMEFKQLEREREKLRMERERIEKEKLELIKLERERQKTEREKIEREKEELRRAKINIEHSHRPLPLKRPHEEEIDRRRESAERKKPYTLEGERMRGRPEVKTEAERRMERERHERERMNAYGSHASAEGRSRSPMRDPGVRESRRDIWARDERQVRKENPRSEERVHRREPVEPIKAVDRRTREAPSRAVAGPSDMVPRYQIETSRAVASSKRPSDRYEESGRTPGREDQWMPRSYLTPSSLSMPLSSSTATSRDSWPMAERKIEAWDTSRLPARSDQWISGAGATLGTSGRSSLPVLAPPPPIYSPAASLALPGSSSLGLGSYASERYDGYKHTGGGFHHMRRF